MIDVSNEIALALLVVGLLVAILLGFPLIFSLGGVALIVGLIGWGTVVPRVLYLAMWGTLREYTFLAVPLFVFMGTMVQQSGMAERLFGTLHTLMGGLKGGLAIATIFTGTLLAAGVGVVTASVVMLGLIALPAMLDRGYDKGIATGSVCAGGTLGILIPPSIMLVLYGPTAGVSVGWLFMGAFIPGLVLSIFYMTYVGVRCAVRPQLAPEISKSEASYSVLEKGRMLVLSVLPPLMLILVVLGSIFFGVATPTEAAAVGAAVSILMALGYRRLNWRTFVSTLHETLRVASLVYGIAIGASMFTRVFLGLGGGGMIVDLLTALPFGQWGAFVGIMLLTFLLGMFIDWIGIVFILVPLITPVGEALGFHPVWFAMMIIINLQMSFLTPPFCPTVFVLKGIIRPEWEIDTKEIIMGVLPFVPLIALILVLCIAFPDIILWLPGQMMR